MSLSFLAIGAIVLFQRQGPPADGQIAVSAVSFVLALAVIAIGRGRARRMPASPRAAVLLVGSATLGLAALVLTLIAVSD